MDRRTSTPTRAISRSASQHWRLGILAIAGAALTLAGCASTQVSRYETAPGQEVRIGEGGAVETVTRNGRSIDLWLEGTPPKPFKILGRAKSEYVYGALDREWNRNAAIGQMADAAIAQGGDAVVIGSEASGTVGSVYVPGVQTTNIQRAGSGYRATTTGGPGVSGGIGQDVIVAYIVKYVER
jgi:hypothetical protein